MARPRKNVESGETTSVPLRVSKYDLDWLDAEMENQGYKSRAEVLRDALKHYRWSKEDRRAVSEEVKRALRDPEISDCLTELVTEKVFRKMTERMS